MNSRPIEPVAKFQGLLAVWGLSLAYPCSDSNAINSLKAMGIQSLKEEKETAEPLLLAYAEQ